MFAREQLVPTMKLILTCEHGGNFLPKEYRILFQQNQHVLETHRGYDLGSLDVYKFLKPLADFSIANETSRLLIEVNRSLHHKNLFSEFSKNLSTTDKNHLIKTIYLPYRNQVEKKIKSYIKNNDMVCHLSIHSFTPIFNNIDRLCDIGILYDSKNQIEKEFSRSFKSVLLEVNPHYKVRFNYPYLGKADGFTTYLRKQFPLNYMGIEIELNQKYSIENVMPLSLKKDILCVVEALIKKQKHLI